MYIRTCKYCGKQFESATPGKQICPGPHYQTCSVCGNQFAVATKDIYRDMCCSDECKKSRRNLSIKQVLSAKQSGWNKPKTIYHKTCELCGKEFDTHNYRMKYCQGPHYRTCKVCRTQFELTYDQIMNKTQTCSEACRVSNSRITQMGEESGQLFNEFNNDPERWIQANYGDIHPTYFQLCAQLNRPHSTVQQSIDRHNCSHLISKYVSNMEQEVIDFIRSLNSETVIIHNDRNIIKPKELDIYLPEYKLGIECNPTYTHNSSLSAHREAIMPPSYHQMKTNMCEDKGIRLIHIFGYEWKHNREVLESIIQNALGMNSSRIYARKCTVKEVSSSEASEFLSNNHRQGKVGSSVRLGLFYDDELVSLMTFGKLRGTIGGSGDGYELLRFCSCKGLNVIGGASKLFKYFLSRYEPKLIRSFSDRAHTVGNLYQVLGFSEVSRSTAGYVWVDAKTDKAYHRANAQKHNIKKFLRDHTIDLNKTERQIMTEHGFVRVYDSGTITWEWTS